VGFGGAGCRRPGGWVASAWSLPGLPPVGPGRRLRARQEGAPEPPGAEPTGKTRLDYGGWTSRSRRNTRFGGGGRALRPGPGPSALAAALGSTQRAGGRVGARHGGSRSPRKSPCRSGRLETPTRASFQRACYTDIYPLLLRRGGLPRERLPYTGHLVEYPVLIGGGHAGRGLGWCGNVSEVIRGREFLRRHRGAARGRSARWAGVLGDGRGAGRVKRDRARRAQAPHGGAVSGADPCPPSSTGTLIALAFTIAGHRRLGCSPRCVWDRRCCSASGVRDEVLSAGGYSARCCWLLPAGRAGCAKFTRDPDRRSDRLAGRETCR